MFIFNILTEESFVDLPNYNQDVAKATSAAEDTQMPFDGIVDALLHLLTFIFLLS